MSETPKMLHGFRHSTNTVHAKMAGCMQGSRYCATCKKYKHTATGHKQKPVFKCADCVKLEQPPLA